MFSPSSVEEEGAGGCRYHCWVEVSRMTMPPPLRLVGVLTSSFTSGFGVSGVEVPQEEEEPEPDDNEHVLLGAQRFGGGVDVVNEGEGA